MAKLKVKPLKLRSASRGPIYVPQVGRVAPGEPFELLPGKTAEYLLHTGAAVRNKGGRPRKELASNAGVDV